MRILHQTYPYVLKHRDVASKSFHARMVCSMMTMIMCLVVFCSATYAWFTDVQTSAVAPIQSATYSVSVESETGNVCIDENLSELTYTSPLVANDMHTFTLTGGGTTQTGYAVIHIGENDYFTSPIAPNESITLSIQAAQGSVISFSANWGEPTDSLSTISDTDITNIHFLCDGDLIEVSQTPYQTYIVEKLVTLEQIAAHYGVSVEDIVIYNGLTADINPDSEDETIDDSNIALTEGMELKIPNTDITEPFTLAYSIYVLEKFVTLEEIAAYYGVSAEDILVYNGIAELPEAGTAILIPNPITTETFVSNVTYASYIVEEGVTLEQLAEYYGVSAEDILYFNDITELVVGAELKIPNTEVTEPFVLPKQETDKPKPDEVIKPTLGTETLPNEEEEKLGTDSDIETEESTEKETVAETEAGDTTETVSTEIESTETEGENTTESEAESTETSTSEEAGTENEVAETSELEENTSDSTEALLSTESLETETVASEMEAAVES